MCDLFLVVFISREEICFTSALERGTLNIVVSSPKRLAAVIRSTLRLSGDTLTMQKVKFILRTMHLALSWPLSKELAKASCVHICGHCA